MHTVSTTDFFYPLVESPYLQGWIAACNVLSDMYAIGVTHIDTVLMLLAQSRDMIPSEAHIVTQHMMCGFSDACAAAETSVTGGQTVLNPWPIIGGVAMSICMSADFIQPHGAEDGDVLVLTKPLGTQVAVNCKQWSSDITGMKMQLYNSIITGDQVQQAYTRACQSMSRLNRNAAQLMHKYHVHAATDITGFGLLGHLDNLVQNQKAELNMTIHTMPVIQHMSAVSRRSPSGDGFKLHAGYSAETSGGLLIAMPASSVDAYIAELRELDQHSDGWLVGTISAGQRTARLADDVRILDV